MKRVNSHVIKKKLLNRKSPILMQNCETRNLGHLRLTDTHEVFDLLTNELYFSTI